MALSILALVFIVIFTADDMVWQTMREIKPAFLFLAFSSLLCALLVRSFKIRYLANSMDPDIKLSQVLGITFVYHFVNNVTPFTFGGIPAQIYLLSRRKLSPGQATAISVIEGAFTWGLYAVLGAILLLVKSEPGLILPDMVVRASLGTLSIATIIFS